MPGVFGSGSGFGGTTTREDMSGESPEDQLKATIALNTPGYLAPQPTYDDEGIVAQQRALASMQQMVAGGGWTPAMKQAFQHQQAMSAGLAAGHRAGAEQQMIARGMSPALAKRLSAQVGQSQQAETGYQSGLAAQDDAEKRAFAAEQGAGQMATQIRGEKQQRSEFDEGLLQSGIMAALKAQRGQTVNNDMREQAQQAQTAQGATTVGTGLATMAGGAIAAASARRAAS